MSRTRRWLLFRLLALAFVPALLVAAELALRAVEEPVPTFALPAAWDQDVRVIPDHGRDDLMEIYTGAAGEQRARSSATMRQGRFMHEVDYAVQRPAGVFRVFCFGGSATLGVPVESTPEQTFPGRLQALLEEGGLQAEVINLGGASFGSSKVVELMSLAAGHQPSAFVVYSGNNEFFEYSLELHRHNAHQAERLLERRSGLRLVRWLFGASDRLRGVAPNAEPPGPQELELLQRALVRSAVEGEMAADPQASPERLGQLMRRRDAPYRAVVARYEANLDAMVQTARGVAPLILVTVPANLHEAPFEVAHSPSLSAGDLGRWERLVSRATEQLSAGELQQAVDTLDAAIALDPVHARAYALQGEALADLGDYQRAATSLHNALELDLAPGRPTAAQGEAIQALHDPPAVVVVDPSASFEAKSLAGGGKGYFHDSCHLTPEGYALLARHLVQPLLDAAAAAPTPE